MGVPVVSRKIRIGQQFTTRSNSVSGFRHRAFSSPIETDTCIAIDPISHSVTEGMLLCFELPIKAGQTLDFTGTVEFIADSGEELAEVKKYIVAGLRMVSQFGANSSTGFGRLLKVRQPVVASQDCSPATTSTLTFKSSRVYSMLRASRVLDLGKKMGARK